MGKRTSHKTKFDVTLPHFLDKKVFDFVASRREKKTTKEEKFTYLIKRDTENLLIPSIDEKKIRNKTRKTHKKKQNKILRNFAIQTLNKSGFVEDILNLAKINGLFEWKYDLFLQDFYLHQASSAINAWECRLKYLSLIYLSKKIHKSGKDYDIKKLFTDTYLPPKFEQKVLSLMNKYGLEFFWLESIEHLLLTGLWYLPRNSSVIFMDLETPPGKFGQNKATLSLGIYSMTSREEIYYRWNEIESLKKQMFPAMSKRLKIKDLKEFIIKFEDEEHFQDLRYSLDPKARNSFNKKIARDEKAHDEFIASFKSIPKDILLQILTLGEYSLTKLYLF